MRAAIFGISGTTLTAQERAFFQDADPFGFILFDRNIDTPHQVTTLTASLRDLMGRDCPILIDQEGGQVQRLWPPYWRSYPPALEQASNARDLERAMWLRGRLIGEELYAVGIDVNCAPLGDLAYRETTPRVKNRCYGFDAPTVIPAARALAQGQADGGVLGVLKHLPGHGRAKSDSHLELPRVEASLSALEATDFAPFKALSHIPMAMTAHVLYDALDPDAAFTVSATAVAYARQTLGYQGLLMSDDLDMDALEGPLAGRAQRTLAAGVDIVLHCNGTLADMQEVAAACHPLTGRSLERAEAAIAQKSPPKAFDTQSAIAELGRLTEN